MKTESKPGVVSPKDFETQKGWVTEYRLQPYSLLDLIHGIPNHSDEDIREGHCIFGGIQLIPKGSELFEGVLENERKRLEKACCFEPDEIEKTVSTKRARDLLTLSTNFWAMRVPRKGSFPCQAFMTNKEQIALVYFETKEITLLPYADFQDGQMTIYMGFLKFSGPRWLYTGTFGDALSEFAEAGYSFNKARGAMTPQEKSELFQPNREEKIRNERRYIILAKNISTEEVLGIASGKTN